MHSAILQHVLHHAENNKRSSGHSKNPLSKTYQEKTTDTTVIYQTFLKGVMHKLISRRKHYD